MCVPAIINGALAKCTRRQRTWGAEFGERVRGSWFVINNDSTTVSLLDHLLTCELDTREGAFYIHSHDTIEVLPDASINR
jgi:hypothetical protein